MDEWLLYYDMRKNVTETDDWKWHSL